MEQLEQRGRANAFPFRIRMTRFHILRTDWLARAALLPGRTLHYAVAVNRLASITRSAQVAVDPMTLVRFGLTRDAAGDALTRLVAAGLVRASRGRGRVPVLTLLDRSGKDLLVYSSDA